MGRRKTDRGQVADQLNELLKLLTPLRQTWAGPIAPSLAPENDPNYWEILANRLGQMSVHIEVTARFAQARHAEALADAASAQAGR